MARTSQNKSGKKGLIGVLVETPEEYANRFPVFEALCSEANYIVTQAIIESQIKIHEIESRIKTYDSIARKLNEASAGFAEGGLTDTVGLRIICLFRSDLNQIYSIIEKEFIVISSDNKIEAAPDTFGYMSVHYLCRLKDEVKGRRYDAIKGLIFEVQVRTLCMHAWAVISHYLDYKAEWDIPGGLKKDLNALSALFYLADTQYEQIFNARDVSRATSATELATSTAGSTPINLDTLFAFLSRKYPDRALDRSSVSSLTGELIEAGIDEIEELSAELDRRKEEFEAAESKRREGPFAAVGVVRISLRDTHPGYKAVYDAKNRKS